MSKKSRSKRNKQQRPDSQPSRSAASSPSAGASNAGGATQTAQSSPSAGYQSLREPAFPSAPSEHAGDQPAPQSAATSQPLSAAQRERRRLILWGASVVVIGVAARAVTYAMGPPASPTERFNKFAQALAMKLGAMYGEDDGLGLPPLPYPMEFKVKPNDASRLVPFSAELRFQEADLVGEGGLIVTTYSATYRFEGGEWICNDLRVDVHRPGETPLGQLAAEARVEPDHARSADRFARGKRRQAESQLDPAMPLGKLIRESDRY